jgi:hypothetical protein
LHEQNIDEHGSRSNDARHESDRIPRAPAERSKRGSGTIDLTIDMRIPS